MTISKAQCFIGIINTPTQVTKLGLTSRFVKAIGAITIAVGLIVITLPIIYSAALLQNPNLGAFGAGVVTLVIIFAILSGFGFLVVGAIAYAIGSTLGNTEKLLAGRTAQTT